MTPFGLAPPDGGCAASTTLFSSDATPGHAWPRPWPGWSRRPPPCVCVCSPLPLRPDLDYGVLPGRIRRIGALTFPPALDPDLIAVAAECGLARAGLGWLGLARAGPARLGLTADEWNPGAIISACRSRPSLQPAPQPLQPLQTVPFNEFEGSPGRGGVVGRMTARRWLAGPSHKPGGVDRGGGGLR